MRRPLFSPGGVTATGSGRPKKGRHPGGGRRPSEAPRSGQGNANLPRPSTPSGGRVMTKPQRVPWRDADPLFRQPEIDLVTEWITLRG